MGYLVEDHAGRGRCPAPTILRGSVRPRQNRKPLLQASLVVDVPLLDALAVQIHVVPQGVGLRGRRLGPGAFAAPAGQFETPLPGGSILSPAGHAHASHREVGFEPLRAVGRLPSALQSGQRRMVHPGGLVLLRLDLALDLGPPVPPDPLGEDYVTLRRLLGQGRGLGRGSPVVHLLPRYLRGLARPGRRRREGRAQTRRPQPPRHAHRRMPVHRIPLPVVFKHTLVSA